MRKIFITLVMIGFASTLCFAAEAPKAPPKELAKMVEIKAEEKAEVANKEEVKTKEMSVSKKAKKAKKAKKITKKGGKSR